MSGISGGFIIRSIFVKSNNVYACRITDQLPAVCLFVRIKPDMIKNIFDILNSSLKYKISGKRTPVVVSMSLTGKCNLKCSYCYSMHDNENPSDVPADTVISRIDELYRLGTRVLMLQGGEPLLHKDLGRIIRHVKSRGMYCSVTTNGLNFEKYIDSLKPVDQVQLSIDGGEEITENFRGKGVYQEVLKAAELCYGNAIPFHLHLVLTDRTSEENTFIPLGDIAGKYRSYLNFCIPHPTGAAKGKEFISDANVQRMYRLIRNMKKKGIPINNSYSTIDGIIEWGNSRSYRDIISRDERNAAKKYPKCVMGNLVAWIDSSGKLYPCATRYGDPQFAASVEEYGIKKAWEKLKDIPCHYCVFSSEFNNLLGLKIESVLNGIKFMGRAVKK